MRIESLTPDLIRPAEPLGIDPYGYQVWRLTFITSPERGEDYKWSIRKWLDDPSSGMVDEPWLSLAVSQPRPIESGRLELDLTEARDRPEHNLKSVTPKQTLPQLRGTTEPPDEDGQVVAANFELLVPGHSHGLRWWWDWANGRDAAR